MTPQTIRNYAKQHGVDITIENDGLYELELLCKSITSLGSGEGE